jgi:hypothetical protein
VVAPQEVKVLVQRDLEAEAEQVRGAMEQVALVRQIPAVVAVVAVAQKHRPEAPEDLEESS